MGKSSKDMSRNSGKTTKRRTVEAYKGFSIVKVTVIYWWYYCGYYRDVIDRKEIYYIFCKEGDETKPNKAFRVDTKTVDECKACIDRFLEDDSLYFTEEERKKYVLKPNEKNDWGCSYDELIRLMKKHQKADKRMKRLIEDRLEDINYHEFVACLAEKDYDGYMKYAGELYPVVYEVRVPRKVGFTNGDLLSMEKLIKESADAIVGTETKVKLYSGN